jgi:putative transposase
MHAAVRRTTTANAGKIADVRALFPAYRRALTTTTRAMTRDTQQGKDVPSWPSVKPADVGSPLSARHYKSVWNMAHSAQASWLSKVQGEVRQTITSSSLQDDTKTVLYRVNARQAWFATTLELPWDVARDGGLVVPAKGAKASTAQVTLPV